MNLAFADWFCAGVEEEPILRTVPEHVTDVPRCRLCGIHAATGPYMDGPCTVCMQWKKKHKVIKRKFRIGVVVRKRKYTKESEEEWDEKESTRQKKQREKRSQASDPTSELGS